MTVAQKLTPWETYQAVPSDRVAELIDGRVFAHAKPALPHQEVASQISTFLKTNFQNRRTEGEGPGGWIIMPEVELELLTYVRHFAPDLCGWRRERMPKVPRQARGKISPDWVCEVVSPSDTSRTEALQLKIPIYAESGVPHLWIAHPLDRDLQAFELIAGAWVLLGTWTYVDTARIPPFDATEFALGRVWEDIEDL